MTSPPLWEAWAPPLDPPTPGGLPRDQAEAIAAAWWDDDPHIAAALMWEAYAATLPPSPSVSSVTTGYQSVSYSPAGPGGEFGLALSRAAWHRSMSGGLRSVPLRTAMYDDLPKDPPGNWWVAEEEGESRRERAAGR